jgi:hypothetical protein
MPKRSRIVASDAGIGPRFPAGRSSREAPGLDRLDLFLVRSDVSDTLTLSILWGESQNLEIRLALIWV